MQQPGMIITFNKKGVEISKNRKTMMNGKLLNNLTAIDFETSINRVNSIIVKYIML
jgi:hypothetical protein